MMISCAKYAALGSLFVRIVRALQDKLTPCCGKMFTTIFYKMSCRIFKNVMRVQQ